MKRLLALALLLVALPAWGQVAITSAPCKITDGSCASGGSSLPALTDNAGKVLAVNVGETATEWIAVAGTGTVTSVGISAPNIFAVADSPVIAAGTIAITLATQAKNLVWAGPATGADAAPGFRALVAADLGSFTLSPSLRMLTLQDATGDTTPLTVRASGGVGTAHIAQFQASDNSPLSHIAHDGSFVGNVTGNVTGDVSGNAGTATAAADGLTSASGTAPLTLTLAAKGLTGSVAEFTGDAGAGGAAGIVPAPAAGDALKFLRGDKTWQASAGGGVTNSAGANVITKSDGTNLVATALSETSAGVLATSAGTALSLTATAPAATTGASQVGKDVTITASPAVASTDTAGAAAGGNVTITAGSAARNTSGNASGGNIVLQAGLRQGTSAGGTVLINNSTGSSQSVLSFEGSYVTLNTSTTTGAARLSSTYLTLPAASAVQFANGTMTSEAAVTPDLYLRRRAAANPAWGLAAASPVAYTHSLAADSRSGTDTNVGGANATIQPGAGTGTGTASKLILSTPDLVGSGTGAQTLTPRLEVRTDGVEPLANLIRPFGAIYWATPAATSNESATPIKAAGTTAAQGNTYQVTQATTNRLTYTGTTTRDFVVEATVGVSAASTATTAKFHIYKGGSAVTGATVTRYISNADIGAVAVHAHVSLATNEYVELYLETDDGDDLTIQNGVLSLRSIN